MESDADRLVSIKALGGLLVRHEGGEFFGIYYRPSFDSPDGSVRSRQPVIEARAIDVDSLPKDTLLEVAGESFKIKDHDKESPAPGWTTLSLRR